MWNFPYAAIEEALVNAVYHRSYEEREPIEVRISHEELVILSFPGPDRSIRLEDLFETDDDRLSFVIRLPSHPQAAGAILSTEQVTREVTREVTGEVTGEVERLLRVMVGEMPRQLIQSSLGLKSTEHFRTAYLKPALAVGAIAMTLPDKPRSSKQRYRLTDFGQHWLKTRPSPAKG